MRSCLTKFSDSVVYKIFCSLDYFDNGDIGDFFLSVLCSKVTKLKNIYSDLHTYKDISKTYY